MCLIIDEKKLSFIYIIKEVVEKRFDMIGILQDKSTGTFVT